MTPLIGQTHSLQAMALGQLGGDFIDNAADVTGDWGAITCLVDATFVKCVTSTFRRNGAATTDLGAITMPKGITIYGKFSELQLSAGTIIAYRASVAAY